VAMHNSGSFSLYFIPMVTPDASTAWSKKVFTHSRVCLASYNTVQIVQHHFHPYFYIFFKTINIKAFHFFFPTFYIISIIFYYYSNKKKIHYNTTFLLFYTNSFYFISHLTNSNPKLTPHYSVLHSTLPNIPPISSTNIVGTPSVFKKRKKKWKVHFTPKVSIHRHLGVQH